jgi:hypothetical protein
LIVLTKGVNVLKNNSITDMRCFKNNCKRKTFSRKKQFVRDKQLGLIRLPQDEIERDFVFSKVGCDADERKRKLLPENRSITNLMGFALETLLINFVHI